MYGDRLFQILQYCIDFAVNMFQAVYDIVMMTPSDIFNFLIEKWTHNLISGAGHWIVDYLNGFFDLSFMKVPLIFLTLEAISVMSPVSASKYPF